MVIYNHRYTIHCAQLNNECMWSGPPSSGNPKMHYFISPNVYRNSSNINLSHAIQQ